MGTTSVKFNARSALAFTVVDSTLITAVVPKAPPGANNTFVKVRITDDEGTTPKNEPFHIYYSDATSSVTPDTGLTAGTPVTASASGYVPNQGSIVIAEVNPLAGFLENIPPDLPPGPPPYVVAHAPFPRTDENGDVSYEIEISGDERWDGRAIHDANADCPVNQATADVGLPQCFIAVTQFGSASLESFIDYADQFVPAAPVLKLSRSSATDGDAVGLGGIYWNAAPLFGSAAAPDDPGETMVTVELCDIALLACAEMTSDAEVEMTRYFDGEETGEEDDTVQGVFTGTTLTGSFTVDGAGCRPACWVRVRQERYDLEAAAPVPGQFVEAVMPLKVASVPVGDGPPVIEISSPQVHHPDGGTPVRIYGDNFGGTTEVTFGGVPSEQFVVVDADLIIASVPPADPDLLEPSNDGYAHIEVTDNEGTGTTDLNLDGEVEEPGLHDRLETGAMLYSDATMSLEPNTGMDANGRMALTVTGYRPSAYGAIVQIKPLENLLENRPEDEDSFNVGPPYGDVESLQRTDPLGTLMIDPVDVRSGDVECFGCRPFNLDDRDFDPDATCPVRQVTADYGLDRCFITFSQIGNGSLERYFSFSPDEPTLDPVPADPVLVLDVSSPEESEVVALDGEFWNAAPWFGSDTSPDDPGESTVTIELCDVASSVCTPVGAPTAAVEIVRYRDGDSDPDHQPVAGVYSGATLSGSFTMPGSAPCAPDCVVRVRQQRYDFELNAPVEGAFIEAVVPLDVLTASPG